jgi:catechol 2,3-dioxygenase-like lactoylglutathione lyase family enzyme
VPISAVRLNHAVLYRSYLERAIGFYTSVLGLKVMVRERRRGAAFLRLPRSGNHHDLGSEVARSSGVATADQLRPLPAGGTS